MVAESTHTPMWQCPVIESTVKGLVGVKGLGQWAWANHMEDLQVTVMMD